MSKTLKQLAQEALRVQDACNLCGVAHSFARVMTDLGEHTSGTDGRNTHPIAMVWADKIAHLTGTQQPAETGLIKAYEACYALAEQGDGLEAQSS